MGGLLGRRKKEEMEIDNEKIDIKIIDSWSENQMEETEIVYLSIFLFIIYPSIRPSHPPASQPASQHYPQGEKPYQELCFGY